MTDLRPASRRATAGKPMTKVVLTDIDTLKLVLGKAGIKPARSAGQNFLICSEVIEATLAAAADGPKRVTELGAGVGTVTQALMASGYRVRAIEKDKLLAKTLERYIPPAGHQHLELITQDMRRVPWEHNQPYQLIGNIPYNLSGLIIRRITQLDPPPVRVLLLVQKEVGQRLAASPPDMNLLGLAAQLWGQVHVLLNVPASCFWPQPQVSSQLVLLVPTSDAAGQQPQREQTLAVAKIFFQARRKQIGGVLRRSFALADEEAAEVLGSLGLKPTQRPQEISVQQWKTLAKELRKHVQ